MILFRYNYNIHILCTIYIIKTVVIFITYILNKLNFSISNIVMSEIIYGIHVIQSFVEHYPNNFINIYIEPKQENYRLKLLVEKIKKIGIIPKIVTQKQLNKKANTHTHQGIVAYVRKIKKLCEKDLVTLLNQNVSPLLLILDQITDSHNFGACLRCAEAVGVHAVIVPKNHTAALNAVTKKAASGAADIIPLIYVVNLVRILKVLKHYNIQIIGTSNTAKNNLYHSTFTGPIALIAGSENKGIRKLIQKHCDKLINIPILGTVTSLNVSVAVGICLFEIFRQRNFNNLK